MSTGVRFAILAGAALALAACGKPASTASNGGADQAANPTEPASAPPAAGPTDAQKKAMLATLPAAYQTADLENGEIQFAVCRSCHTLTQGGPNQTGPNLWGIFGRKAGAKSDFTYSDALRTAGWTWDADRINTWITNPRAVLPGTKMTFLGMADPKNRTDLIAYLKVSTTAPPAS